MGVCGCADFNGVRWAVTVGDFVLAASDYRGCNSGCDTPVGFSIHLMTREAASEWGVEPTGEWTPTSSIIGWEEQFLNLFSPSQIVAAAREIEKEDHIDLSEYDSLADVLSDVALDLIRAAWDRQLNFEANLAKRLGEKPPFAKPARKARGRKRK